MKFILSVGQKKRKGNWFSEILWIIFSKNLQSKIYHLFLYLLFVFHLEISGNDKKDSQILNIKLISIALLVFNFEIFGNDYKDL